MANSNYGCVATPPLPNIKKDKFSSKEKLSKQIVFYIKAGTSLEKLALDLYYQEEDEYIISLSMVLYKVMSEIAQTGKSHSLMFEYKNEDLKSCIVTISNVICIVTDIIPPEEFVDKLYSEQMKTQDEIPLSAIMK